MQSFAEFERVYGGLWVDSTLSYAVQQYFLNGGRDALIARVHNAGVAATLTLPDAFDLDRGERRRLGRNPCACAWSTSARTGST